MKFKIGDKVRFVEDVFSFAKVGDKGVIVQNDRSDVPFNIKLNNGRFVWCSARYIVHDEDNLKIVITTDGKKTTARLYNDKECVKTATAKCSTDDEFDFEEGARIAFDRLVKKEERDFDFYIRLSLNGFSFTKKGDVLKAHKHGIGCFVYEKDLPRPTHNRENGCYKWFFAPFQYDRISDEEAERALAEKDEFVPHLEKTYVNENRFFGNLGEPTKYKDAIGRPLFVGDVVEIFYETKSRGDYVLAKDNKCAVMSIWSSCDEKTGTTGDWKILKKRSYTEVKHGEVVGLVKFVKEP